MFVHAWGVDDFACTITTLCTSSCTFTTSSVFVHAGGWRMLLGLLLQNVLLLLLLLTTTFITFVFVYAWGLDDVAWGGGLVGCGHSSHIPLTNDSPHICRDAHCPTSPD